MISFAVLGEVSARDGAWVAKLSPLQQLLLAVLVVERGRPVSRLGLARALWGEPEDHETARRPEAPEAAVKRIACEVRTELRAACPDENPLPSGGDTYRLVLSDQQADVLRFRAKINEARRCQGRDATRLMAAAVREWGPDAAGLFGGQPLTGLAGRWAESSRETLRAEYREARFQCLWQDYEDHKFGQVAMECRELARETAALHDEKFLALWMVAVYRAGHRTQVERIYQSAADSAQAHLGLPLSGYITQLAEVIRTEDPRLDGPGDLFELDLLRPRSAVMTHKPGRSMSDGDTTISFTNSGHAHIGAQVGAAHEPITITMAADTGQDMDQEAAPHEEDEPDPDSGQQSSR